MLHMWTLECQVGEFMCDNGQCILEADLCNGVRDCEDGSDEPQGYCFFNENEGKVFTSYRGLWNF